MNKKYYFASIWAKVILGVIKALVLKMFFMKWKSSLAKPDFCWQFLLLSAESHDFLLPTQGKCPQELCFAEQELYLLELD